MTAIIGVGDFGLGALVDEAKGYRDEAKLYSEMSQADYEDKGLYDPVLNLPPLTADASVGAGSRPQKYIISKDGELQFEIDGFEAGYEVKVNDELRQNSDDKWYVYRDENAIRIAEIDGEIKIVIPMEGGTVGASGTGGTAITATSKIQVPNGVSGEGTQILKQFNRNTYPDLKDGDQLSFAIYVTETTAGISDTNRLTNNLYVQRNGATITATVTNKKYTRLSTTKVMFTFDYTVQAGDTVFWDVIAKFNHVNGSGSTWEWQITRAEFTKNNVVYGTNSLSDTLFLNNKRIVQNENNIAVNTAKVALIDGKISLPNLANPAEFEHGKVMATDGVKLDSENTCLSGKIKVTPGLPYSGHTFSNYMRYIVYFNATDNPIGGVNATWTPTFTPPANTDYVRVSFAEVDAATFMLSQAAAPEPFVAYGTAIAHNLRVPAADIIPSSSLKMVSDAQTQGWDSALLISQKITRQNLANPSLFVSGKVMQSNGVAVTAAQWSYCRVDVTAGTEYFCNTDADTGCRYGCFLEADGVTPVAGSGWNGADTKNFTPPAGAAIFLGTFPTTNTATVRVGIGHDDPGFTPYSQFVTKDISMPAADVKTTSSRLFASQTEKDNWNLAKELADKFKRTNLADPSLFTTGKVVQSDGVIVNASQWTITGKIAVTPGQVISMNTAANTGFRYGCYFASNGSTVVTGGWDGSSRTTETVPINAAWFQGTFPTVNADSVMVQLAPAPTGYVPYANMYTNEVFVAAESVVTNSSKMFVTSAEKARLATLTYLDDKFAAFEAKGILQRKIIAPSPIAQDISKWVEVLLQGDKDIITDCENGSKSTGVAGYCSPTPNSNTWPEFCREQNLYSKWVYYMWKTYFHSQKHERFDTAGRFSITGNIDTSSGSGYAGTNNAPHWGHQWDNSSTGEDFGGPVPNGQVFFDRYYQIIKPITGSAAISFALPDSYYKMAWITSWSHLTGTITFTVAGGANRIERCTDIEADTWVEAHNSTLNTATPDEFKTVSYTTAGNTSTKIRKDQHSMPILFRRKAGFTLSDGTVITATMQAGKQIEHWGIYYTRSKRLFIPVCSAKGSHSAADLAPFHEFGIDKRKPGFFMYDVDIVNQWRVASVAPTDTPTQYATRVRDFAADILGKPYIKAMLCRFGMWHRNMNLFESGSDQPTEYLTSEGYNNGFDYMRRALLYLIALKDTQNADADAAKHGRIAISDAQPAFLAYLRNYAADKGISIYEAIWSGSFDPNADTPTMDGTHDGNMGAEIQWRFDNSNWNF